MSMVMSRVARLAIFGTLPLSLLTIAAGLYVFAGKSHIPLGEYLSIREVCQRWENRPLDVTAFRSAEDDEPVRAAMACSLLKNQDDYVGIDMREIEQLFGDPRGYFISESHPAYLIETAKTKKDNSWQIVFMTNRDAKVTKIIVHKNCC